METLRKQIQELESEIAELEEKVKIKESEDALTLARMQARLFMEMIFAPCMDGICDTWGVSPEEGLRKLIDDETTIDRIAKDNPEALLEVMNQPEVQVIINITRPIGKMPDEWIKDKMTILLDVMAELRPELARGIIETPGGTEWFYDSLTGIRDVIFFKPQLNIETP